jgi:hypothetical protein
VNVMNKLGCNWRPSEKGAGTRLAGKSAIHARLALRSDGSPGLLVFRSCHNLIYPTSSEITTLSIIPRALHGFGQTTPLGAHSLDFRCVQKSASSDSSNT